MKDISENETTANKILAECMGILALLGMLLLLLFSLGALSEYDHKYTNAFFVLAVGILITPFILISICRFHFRWVKYICLILCTVACSIVTIFSRFDFILLMYIPTVLSTMYFNKNITYSTIVFTTISFVVSYLISDFILTDIPHWYDECLPNLIIYLIIAFISYVISRNTDRLRKMSNRKAKTINSQNDALDKVISNSLEIFGARSLDEFDDLVMQTLKSSVRPFLQNPASSIRILFGHLTGEKFSVITPEGNIHKILPNDDLLYVDTGRNTAVLKVKRKSATFDYSISDRLISICLYNKTLIHFIVVEADVVPSETLEEIIQLISNNIGIALRNLKLSLDMAESQAEMIYAFSKVTDSRSHHTGNHIKRVSEYMRVLAIEAGYSPDYADKISIASMMHDIGKILIPNEIIEKKSGLTDDEYAIVKTHTTKGAELINNCPGDVMNLAKIMIREHHERWDGKGYLGMKGEKTHTVSRLIAVADVFDAMISKRPYKEPWPKEKVYETILSESGKQFDPRAVEVFKKSFDKLVEIYNEYKD